MTARNLARGFRDCNSLLGSVFFDDLLQRGTAQFLEDGVFRRIEDVVNAALAVHAARGATHDANLAMRIALNGLDDAQEGDGRRAFGQLIAAGPTGMCENETRARQV